MNKKFNQCKDDSAKHSIVNHYKIGDTLYLDNVSVIVDDMWDELREDWTEVQTLINVKMPSRQFIALTEDKFTKDDKST